MKNLQTNSPIIVIGMHRSGTTLVAKILSQMGVFMGGDLEDNHESESFLALNDFILKTAHAYWDQPLAINNLLEDEVSVNILSQHIQEQVNRKTFKVKFNGVKNLLKSTEKWGWKDPRNTLTLPLWKSIYPEAKFIFVYRNGIDVANSLYQREIKVRGGINLPHYSCRCLNINRAFNLWEEYNALFFKQKNLIKQSQLLEIKYEDLLINPKQELEKLIRFTKSKVNSNFSEKTIAGINAKRAYSFINNRVLKDLYNDKKNSTIITRLNYNTIKCE